MSESMLLATARGIAPFRGDGTPVALASLLPGEGPWEVELGFGKGRFLLARAASHPERRFLGVEVAGEYFRLAAGRLARKRLGNVALVRGDALAILATRLPRGFAAALHVYFPDPWPKKRHRKRRLFSPSSVDLLLAALAPGATLAFATDFVDYGREVEALLASHPGVRVERLEGRWPDGARTNYEAKYVAEGRPIVRLLASAAATADAPHPGARDELAVAAVAAPESAAET